MKKISILLLFVILLASCVCSAESSKAYSSNTFPPVLYANYLSWANLLDVSDISDDFSTKQIDDDTSRTLCDTLFVDSNRHTIQFESATLIYTSTGYSEIDMDMRALSLFCALEYGSPLDSSENEINDIISVSIKILNRMKETIRDKSELLRSQQIVPFYIGQELIYTLFQSTDGTLGITAR